MIILPIAAACFHGARPTPVSSADSASIAIEQMISAGRWQTSAGTAGNYRVTIRREGHEEGHRYAVLQWVEDRGNGIVTGEVVDLNQRAHVYALTDPVIVRRGANWILQLRAATSPLTQYDSLVEFVLGDPGTVTLVMIRSDLSF